MILTTEDAVDLWLNAPVAEAFRLQRALPDALRIVSRGEEEDPVAAVPDG